MLELMGRAMKMMFTAMMENKPFPGEVPATKGANINAILEGLGLLTSNGSVSELFDLGNSPTFQDFSSFVGGTLHPIAPTAGSTALIDPPGPTSNLDRDGQSQSQEMPVGSQAVINITTTDSMSTLPQSNNAATQPAETSCNAFSVITIPPSDVVLPGDATYNYQTSICLNDDIFIGGGIAPVWAFQELDYGMMVEAHGQDIDGFIGPQN